MMTNVYTYLCPKWKYFILSEFCHAPCDPPGLFQSSEKKDSGLASFKIVEKGLWIFLTWSVKV
jgi:hypothetical protein